MKNSAKPSIAKNLLPVRVWGVDYQCNLDMAKSIAESSSVVDPIWTNYPLVRASSPDAGKTRSDDPIITPIKLGFGCTASRIEGQPSRSRFGQKLHSIDRVEEAQSLLQAAFEVATKRCRTLKYITPGALMRSAISLRFDDDEPEAPSPTIELGYLCVDSAELSSTGRSFIRALLYLVRELAYRSREGRVTPVTRQIAVAGRSSIAARPPLPFTRDDPKLDLGQSFSTELRDVDLSLPMHCLSFGTSGVGKTHSVIIPRLKAHLRYRLHDGTQSAALLVDPKRELAGITEQYLAERGEHQRLFLAGRDGRLRLFPQDTSLSLSDRVTQLFSALGCNPLQRGDSGPWIQKSLALLLGLVSAHAMTYNRCGQNLFAELMTEAGRESCAGIGYWESLRDVVRVLQEGVEGVRWLHQRLLQRAVALNLQAEERAAFHVLDRFASMDSEAANQISYLTGHLEGPLATLCDPGLSEWLDTTPVPECDEGSSGCTSNDISSLIDGGRVIVFQPPDSVSGDIGTRLLKAQFYRSVMQRKNLHRPVLFLADEFQRYVTGDRESGESNLLDRCRAFRVTAVLATQSVAALLDSLSSRRDECDPRQSVNAILANVGTTLFFQTTDDLTTESLKRSIPTAVPRGWVHPLEVLPLTCLHVGEAYYLAPQGGWGRTTFGAPSGVPE